jgi:hypothetical protein
VVSRLSPGLHVFYTPQRNTNSSCVSLFEVGACANFCRTLLCPILKKVFGGLDCLSPEVSYFTFFVHMTNRLVAILHKTPIREILLICSPSILPTIRAPQ